MDEILLQDTRSLHGQARILDSMLGQGAFDNAVVVTGSISEVYRIDNLSGISFDGYYLKLLSWRPSGIEDEVIAAIPADVMESDFIEENLTEAGRVRITGMLQTIQDFKTGHVLVICTC